MLSDLRTLAGPLRQRLRRGIGPEPRLWSTELVDAQAGRVRLTGLLRGPFPGPPTHPGPEPSVGTELVVLVHGLASRPDSFYCERGAQLLAGAGVASLSLALRGADRSGDDFYNIALTADLHAALASPELATFERVYVIGYSMGGYVTLHYACEADARVKGVAALCTPLDLRAAQRCIDRKRSWLYRKNVLRGLIEIYSKVAESKPVPSAAEEVRRVRTMYEWDRLAIAPRYGYDSPEHYYSELDVARRLGELRVPSLLVGAVGDPIIPEETILPFLPRTRSSQGLEVRWAPRSGHLSFARGALGDSSAAGIELEILAWLRSRSGDSVTP